MKLKLIWKSIFIDLRTRKDTYFYVIKRFKKKTHFLES